MRKENLRFSEEELLIAFNKKEALAFEQVYSMFYKELYLFALSLYKEENEIDCKDIIQDVFLNILENKKISFDSISKIKSYLLILIKNEFLMYCRHKKVVDKHASKLIDEDYMLRKSIEADIITYAPEILSNTPEHCAETIKLLLDGYSIKEISKILDKPVTTIYSQKEKAISVLKLRLPKNKMFILTFF